MLPRVLLAFAVCTLLAGCERELPAADAGSVTRYAGGGVNRAELSAFQFNALMAWLREHRVGWDRRIESTGAPLMVTLRHQNRPTATVHVGPGFIMVNDYRRPLTSAEHEFLVTILTPPQAIEVMTKG